MNISAADVRPAFNWGWAGAWMESVTAHIAIDVASAVLITE